MAKEFIEISEEEYLGGGKDFIEVSEEEFNTPLPKIETATSTMDKAGDFLQSTAMDLEDAIGVIGRIPEALATGIPAQYQKLVSGTAMPKKSEAIEADLAFQAQTKKELEDRKASGELGVMGGALREALPSLSASAIPMVAGIAGGAVGLARGLGNPITAAADAGVASGLVSYRMQGADYLYRSFKQLEENKGSPLTDEERAKAYKELLPLAQDSALWEAGPEAVGNAVSLGVGKFVFGFGKQAATQLARESAQAVEKTLARKIAEKTAAVVGGSATEVGTETITAIGQYAPEMAAKQYAETGTTKGAPTEYPGGIMQAAKDVAPATLATQALFMGAGGAVKLAGLPFEAKPKTPVQIATDNIDLRANKEATNLAIDPTDEAGKGLSETINSIQSNLVNKKEVYSVLEATDPAAQTLKLEIQDDENRLILMQAELNKRAGVEITEAEKAKVEEAKKTAAPEVVPPVAEVVTPEVAVTEVTPTTEVAVTEVTPTETLPVATVAEAATPVVNQEFKDELEMSGVAYDGDTRYSVQQSSNGTFRAERIVNGQKEDIQIGLPDIEAAQNVILDSVGKEVPAIVAETPTPAAQEAPQQKPSGMSVEESKAYLEERNKSTIFGYPIEDIMAQQQGKQVGRTISTPVAETPAVTEAPAAEVAPVQRDITKPEQMTPEERGTQGHKLVIEQARQDFELAKTGQTFGFSGGQTYKSKAAAIKDTKSTFEQVSQPTEADIKRGASDHYGEINRAISDSNPVSAAAVDTYDITLPEGYTKEGDLYVYQPAVSETIAKPKLGEKGGVLIPSREDFIQAGQNIYEKGMEFGAWAKQMIQQFGDVVREFLGDVWQAVSGAPAKLNELMGYLPGKGEAGAVNIRRGQVGGIKGIGQIINTPKGIKKQTLDIIQSSVFNSSEISELNTSKAWELIDEVSNGNFEQRAKNAEVYNQIAKEDLGAKIGKEVDQSIGAATLRNELFNYALKLLVGGNPSMFEYLRKNPPSLGYGAMDAETSARTVGALNGFSFKNFVVQANEAENAAVIDHIASIYFDTRNPSDTQIKAIKDILFAVRETKIDEGQVIIEELTAKGAKVGVDLVDKLNEQIEKATKPEIKDPLVAAITAMLRMGGTFVYTKTKNKIKAAVEKTIKGGITNYRSKLIEGAANGLETGFWKTLSNQENKPGPLGELDNAQNRELGSIVKNALISLGLKGTPSNTKMSIYEQVASILGEKPLSQDKTKSADEKIRQEIESKRQSDLESTEDEDAQNAINLKYDKIELAWDQAMSRQLDMPISDTLLRRLIFNELKEGKTNLAGLAELMNNDPTVGASRQNMVVSAIINKIAGVTFEGQNPADYSLFREYLSNNLESMVQEKQMEKKVVKVKEKVEANQAEREIDKLARIQSDTPNFPTSEKIANPVRDAVRNALKLVLNPMFDPKAAAEIMNNWKKSFIEEVQKLGVNETTSYILADIVGRQIELDSISKSLASTQKIAEKGSIAGIVDVIANTPLSEQMKPDWRAKVMFDYLRSNGMRREQAERLSRLMDDSLQKRFKEAQVEAANKAIKGLKNVGKNTKRGLEALLRAIRTQAIDPLSNPTSVIADSLGWKGFTKDQYNRLNELDSIIKNEDSKDYEKATALREIQEIVSKVQLPLRVRDVISSMYNSNALMNTGTFVLQVSGQMIDTSIQAGISAFRQLDNPALIPVIFDSYITSISSWMREVAYSFKNDLNRSGKTVEFLENNDQQLKRILEEGKRDWNAGRKSQGLKKMIVGAVEFVGRGMKALDDGAYSTLSMSGLTQYAIQGLKGAKIKSSDQVKFMRDVLNARQISYNQFIADGLSVTEATVAANEEFRNAMQRGFAEINGKNNIKINYQDIVTSSVNDALARLGKTSVKISDLTGSEVTVSDKGFLSSPFIAALEAMYKSQAGSSEAYKIFLRWFIGFALTNARIARTSFGYTPFSAYRHFLHKYNVSKDRESRYALSYATDAQQQMRVYEQLAGTLVMAGLFSVLTGSIDDPEDKKAFKVVITGGGPSKKDDPQAYDSWNRKNDPYTIALVFGDGQRVSSDFKFLGTLAMPLYLLGAYDDMKIRQRVTKMRENAAKKEDEKLDSLSQLASQAWSLASFAALATSRRGPSSAFMNGLIDMRGENDIFAAIAKKASFSMRPLIPIYGMGFTKNLSDTLTDPVDKSTILGAILANQPFGNMVGQPVINSFGMVSGDISVFDKVKKGFGLPVAYRGSNDAETRKLDSIVTKMVEGPEPLKRSTLNRKFEGVTDAEFVASAKAYGEEMKRLVLKHYDKLDKKNPADFKKEMEYFAEQARNKGINKLSDLRKID